MYVVIKILGFVLCCNCMLASFPEGGRGEPGNEANCFILEDLS